MNKLGTALLSASALLVAGTASAELPQWTYGQIGYYQADSTGKDQTDGLTVNASLGFLDIWHIQAGYITGSLGQGTFNNDFDGWSVTVGAHPAITEKSQLVLQGSYFDTSYDVDGAEQQSILGKDIGRDGYGFGVGVRTMVTDKVEASAIASWSDSSYDNNGSSNNNLDQTNVDLAFSGRYNWTRNISTGATVILGDNVIAGNGGGDSMNLDVRWTFDGFSL